MKSAHALSALALLLLTVSAHAQQGFAGAWRIARAAHAPWEDPKNPVGGDEKRLLGKTVVFAAKRVIGPSPIGCQGAKYAITDAPFDMLFEGMLAVPPTDHAARGDMALALRNARALGFTGKASKTLDAGCTELQFHMVDENTALFGLNDRVYTMMRKN
ncbi:MAG: hypothetical protein JWN73_1002 [Betaproteobacteria bacterium]|nr:hypothetical protein [Betaproteobacteria bacterium]